MRVDQQKIKATQKEGAKDRKEDLEHPRQPKSAANRDRAERGNDETGQGRMRSQDPGFGRGRPPGADREPNPTRH